MPDAIFDFKAFSSLAKARAIVEKRKVVRSKLSLTAKASSEGWATAENLLAHATLGASPVIESAKFKGKAAGSLTLTRAVSRIGAATYALELVVGKVVVQSRRVDPLLVAQAIELGLSPLAAAASQHPDLAMKTAKMLLTAVELATFDKTEIAAETRKLQDAAKKSKPAVKAKSRSL